MIFLLYSGKIILETIVLLADSIVLPINVEDYVMEIQKAFGNFIQQYQQELHRGNLSIGKWNLILILRLLLWHTILFIAILFYMDSRKCIKLLSMKQFL